MNHIVPKAAATLLLLATTITASPVIHPSIAWKYGWKDGTNANTIGFAKNNDATPSTYSYPGNGYTPSNICTAYGITKIPANLRGAGQTITLIEAYGSPTIQSDLAYFCDTFGLPKTKLQVIYTEGHPPTKFKNDWRSEIALDAEWAHVIAPGATIQVVTSGVGDCFAALEYAEANLNPTIISMSWGSPEWSQEKSFDDDFTNSQIAYFAATGDTRGERDYPAISPNVTAVGGTSLTMQSNSVSGESAWASGGGGVSKYEAVPYYQMAANLGAFREIPDVSAVADPYTGVAVYLTDNTGQGGWMTVGGTSLATPIWAALQACRDSGNQPLPMTQLLYITQRYIGGSWPLQDVTTGRNAYSAVMGYDMATGLGVPRLASQVVSLTGTSQAPPQKATVSLSRLNVIEKTGQGVLASTSPKNIPLSITYNGSPTIPTTIGKYTVGATVISPDYTGGTTNTFTVMQDPYIHDTLNGKPVNIKRALYPSWLETTLVSLKTKAAEQSQLLGTYESNKAAIVAHKQSLSNSLTTVSSQRLSAIETPTAAARTELVDGVTTIVPSASFISWATKEIATLNAKIVALNKSAAQADASIASEGLALANTNAEIVAKTKTLNSLPQ